MLPIMRRQSRAVEYLYRCLVYIDLNMVRARVVAIPVIRDRAVIERFRIHRSGKELLICGI